MNPILWSGICFVVGFGLGCFVVVGRYKATLGYYKALATVLKKLISLQSANHLGVKSEKPVSEQTREYMQKYGLTVRDTGMTMEEFDKILAIADKGANAYKQQQARTEAPKLLEKLRGLELEKPEETANEFKDLVAAGLVTYEEFKTSEEGLLELIEQTHRAWVVRRMEDLRTLANKSKAEAAQDPNAHNDKLDDTAYETGVLLQDLRDHIRGFTTLAGPSNEAELEGLVQTILLCGFPPAVKDTAPVQ